MVSGESAAKYREYVVHWELAVFLRSP